MGDVDEAEQKRIQQERKERALKEREEKVRAERGRVEVDIGRSKVGIYKEEGERDFKCAEHFYPVVHLLWRSTILPSLYRVLLTDAIRDPQVRTFPMYEQLSYPLRASVCCRSPGTRLCLN